MARGGLGPRQLPFSLRDCTAVLLDTNVVQALATFGELIYEGHKSPDVNQRLSRLGSRMKSDIEALADLMPALHQAGWPLVVSPVTLREHQDFRRLDWTWELFDHYFGYAPAWQLQTLERTYLNPDQLPLPFTGPVPTQLDFLPDHSDRLLVQDAMRFRCERLWTLDYRTIWRHRDRISHFGVAVETPSEAWAAFCDV